MCEGEAIPKNPHAWLPHTLRKVLIYKPTLRKLYIGEFLMVFWSFRVAFQKQEVCQEIHEGIPQKREKEGYRTQEGSC